MGLEIAALFPRFRLTGFFRHRGRRVRRGMAWRIVEKAGFPGWAGLGAVLLTLTGIGTIVPLILLWSSPICGGRAMKRTLDRALRRRVCDPGLSIQIFTHPSPRSHRRDGAGRSAGLAAHRYAGQRQPVTIALDNAIPIYLISSAAAAKATELSIPDPSIGQPHARLLTAGPRLGLEDLAAGRHLHRWCTVAAEHGPRDITEHG